MKTQTFEIFGCTVHANYKYFSGYKGSHYEPPEAPEAQIYKYWLEDVEDFQQWLEDNEIEGWYFEEKLLAEIQDFCKNIKDEEAAEYADYLYDLKREEKYL